MPGASNSSSDREVVGCISRHMSAHRKIINGFGQFSLSVCMSDASKNVVKLRSPRPESKRMSRSLTERVQSNKPMRT